MTRRLLGAAAIGCALLLAGCNAATLSADATAFQTKATVAVSSVQTKAVQICGFEPTAATVVKIVGTMVGVGAYTDVGTDIAGRICTAVTTASAQYTALTKSKAKAPPPEAAVNDVPVKGRFVRKPPPAAK